LGLGADLHVHTTHSDGVCSPCEVVVAAARVGLSALAITDHDTVSALAVARPEAARWGVELIAGVELTCVYNERALRQSPDHQAGSDGASPSRGYDDRELHILGHFIRDDDPPLVAAMAALRDGRARRVEAMAARLEALGLSIDLDAVRRAFPCATLGRRHLADYLTRTRQVASMREVFARYLGDRGPACVAKPRLDARRAIALIGAAGGVAALAHPPHDFRHSTFQALVADGMRAVEIDGPGFSTGKSRRLRALAGRLGLVGIAGSDFHAPDRAGRWVGAITTPRDVLERLREARPVDLTETPVAAFSPSCLSEISSGCTRETRGRRKQRS
jgi:3',5'-nucleoside bisphosphate phosphatase